jgi:HK97 gp10 family phage protein
MSNIKFTDRSPEVLRGLESKKAQALEAIGARAETYAKSNTPVDTGNLRNSMAHAVSGDSAYIGSNVEYAPYVEFGTRRNKAHHMLKKAAEGHSDEYKAIAKAALGG